MRALPEGWGVEKQGMWRGGEVMNGLSDGGDWVVRGPRGPGPRRGGLADAGQGGARGLEVLGGGGI